MNPAYDTYEYSYIGPFLKSTGGTFSEPKEYWHFIYNHIEFGPYSSKQEAKGNWDALHNGGECDSCSEEYRDDE